MSEAGRDVEGEFLLEPSELRNQLNLRSQVLGPAPSAVDVGRGRKSSTLIRCAVRTVASSASAIYDDRLEPRDF